MHKILLHLLILLFLPSVAGAVDHVTFQRKGTPVTVSGRVVIDAVDGGLLLMDSQGTLWPIEAKEIQEHTKDTDPFKPLTSKEMGAVMLKELPDGFKVHTTAHYVICYNTSKAYAQWCGALFERLYRAFTTFWKHKGFELKEPELPMVAVVFEDKASFDRYMTQDIGAARPIVGYYNLINNRMAMYDLTGLESQSKNKRSRSSKEISKLLSQPKAGMVVATIVHEATHQIAFNCGLQTRLADVPFWLSEGIAMYFETPDLYSSKGWRGVGKVNLSRLNRFRIYSRKRPSDSLKTLLESNDRLQKAEGVLNSYAESWALVYYLLKRHPKEFVAYMKLLSEKSPLVEDSAKDRVKEFEDIFGNLERVDRDFLRGIKRVH